MTGLIITRRFVLERSYYINLAFRNEIIFTVAVKNKLILSDVNDTWYVLALVNMTTLLLICSINKDFIK